MTMTADITTEATETETPTVAVVSKPQGPADLLRTVAVFSGNDATIPVLHSVQLESDGRTITARATDRYSLAEATFEAEPHKPFTALVSARGLTAALKATVSARSYMLRITPNDDGSVALDNFETTYTVPKVYGEFPTVSRLWPADTEPADSLPYGAVGISASNLAKLAKVSKKGILRFQLSPGAHNKPAVVTVSGQDNLRILVMMARVTD